MKVLKRKKKDDLGEKIKREWKYLNHIRKMNENHLLSMGLIISVTALVVINTVMLLNRSNNGNLTDGSKVNVSTSNTILTTLQPIITSAYVAKVSNVTESEKKDPAFTLSSDQTLLVMDFSLRNTTNSKQTIIPVQQLYIRSRTGEVYALHPSIYVTRNIAAGDVAPNQFISGQLSFGVPKSLTDPLLYIDLGWNNLAPTVVSVLK